MKKRVIKIIAVLAAIGAVCGGGYYYRNQIMDFFSSLQAGKTEDKVYVEKLSAVMGYATGDTSRYNGIVEAMGAYELTVDTSRTIAEILVKEGDTITEGQEVAKYDVGEIELQMQLAELELESINNEISAYKKEIEDLQAEISQSTDEDEKYSNEMDIKSIENSILQSELDLASKQIEIDNYKKQIEEAVIVSKYAGVVKEINESGYDNSGDAAAFMKIMQSGQYHVKGNIDEQNVWMLTEGQEVLIRSRVDDTKTWTGKVAKLDTNTIWTDSSSSDYEDESGESSTKYPFYIELESAEGLLLGQHVYIEMDNGQETERQGVWLYSEYITQEEDKAYVWIADENMKLKKQTVELGEYDEDLDEYEILSGLSETDYIAWNMEGLAEGMTAVTNIDEIDYDSPLYNLESTEEWDEDYDEEYYEDEDDAFYEEDEGEELYEEGYDRAEDLESNDKAESEEAE